MTRGIVRKIDVLGRLTFPKEARKTLNINEGDELEIFVEDDGFSIKKYNPRCICCGQSENLISKNEKLLCKNCIRELAESL